MAANVYVALNVAVNVMAFITPSMKPSGPVRGERWAASVSSAAFVAPQERSLALMTLAKRVKCALQKWGC